MRRICVINYKGGTGKTCTVVNLAHGLAKKGQKVLIIDTDPQGSSGYHLGVKSQKTLYDLLVKNEPLENCIINARENLDMITANEHLFPAEIELVSMPNRETILRQRLMNLSEEYDFVLIDCCPSINLLNQNAMLASDEIFIPVSMEYLTLLGIRQLLNNIKIINKLSNHGVRVSKIIPTFFDKRNRKTKRVVESVERVFPSIVSTPIRSCVSVSEAPGFNKTIFEFAPKSRGSLDYARLADDTLDNKSGGQE